MMAINDQGFDSGEAVHGTLGLIRDIFMFFSSPSDLVYCNFRTNPLILSGSPSRA